MVKRTPTPWDYDGDGFDSVAAQMCNTDGYTIFPIDKEGNCIGGAIAELCEYAGDEEANAAFIVEACNYYEKLKADNAALLEALKVLCDPDWFRVDPEGYKQQQALARKVISKVEGE